MHGIRFGKLFLAFWAGFKFLGAYAGRSHLAYVHVGSNASLYRESAFIVLAKSLGLRVICHFHAGDLSEYLVKQTGLGRRFIRWALGQSDRVIAVSRESASDVRKLLPAATITLLPNTIALKSFRPNERSGAEGIMRLLFVGSADKLKGERDLIAALQLLSTRQVPVTASFVGYGTDKLIEECEAAGIGHMIAHLGPVATEDRVRFYQNADVFVLPTYAEAMPISVIEAMASGLPVITTAVGGIPEIIDDGKEGLFFKCGDVRDLADKIIQLSSDTAGRHKMGERARQRISHQLNFDKYIDCLVEEIERTRSNGKK